MTLSGMLTDLRYRLDDIVGAATAKLWPDSELRAYIDTVQYEVAAECHCLRDPAVSVAFAAGDTEVSLGEHVIAVEAVSLSGKPVAIKTLADLVDAGAWPAPPVGTPSRIAPLDSVGTYAMDREAADSGTLRCAVVTLPSQPGVLVIPAKYHQRMISGVLMWAFSKPDTEAFSAAKRDFYGKMYERDKELIKRTELRVHPRRVTHKIS